MISTPTIKKNPDYAPYRNYDWLRESSLEYIERIAHEVWSEYNPTDPGVTILEVLCYALTDLGMRMDMPIQDLLVDQTDGVRSLHRQFHTALEIFPNAPLTFLDYRKLFLQVEGVKNAWLEKVAKPVYVDFKVDNQAQPPKISYHPFDPVERTRSFEMRGFYNVLLEYEDEVYQLRNNARTQRINAIQEEVRRTYHRNRNLGEDLLEIKAVPVQEVVVCGEIELTPNANAHEVNARILQLVQDYLSPSVPFYSLEDLLKENYPTEDIFSGPLYRRNHHRLAQLLGVLNDDAELLAYLDSHGARVTSLLSLPEAWLENAAQHLEEIREAVETATYAFGFVKDEDLEGSELRREIRVSDIMNLLLELEEVKEIRDLYIGLCNHKDDDEEECNCGEIDPDSDPWKICLDGTAQANLCFQRSNFRFYKDFLPLTIDKGRVQKRWEKLEQENTRIRFSSRVADLPLPKGLYREPGVSSPIRNDLPETYGVGPLGVPPVVGEDRVSRQAEAAQLTAYLQFFEQVLATYFCQLGKVSTLLSVDQNAATTYFTKVMEADDLQAVFKPGGIAAVEENWLPNHRNGKRRHQIVDHLIGRFAERFSDYVYALFDQYDENQDQLILTHKEQFLRDYPGLSARRACAYNYYESSDDYWNTDNVSGLQRRLARLGGFDTADRMDLGGVSYEFYQDANAANENDFRWRFRDEFGKVLFSSTRAYRDTNKALTDLNLAFEQAKIDANIEVQQSNDAWFFIVKDNADRELARRLEVFESEELAVAAKDYVIEYLSDEPLAHEGIYLIEHILLRPALAPVETDDTHAFFSICHDQETDHSKPLDKYSFSVSVILPGWTRRFSNPDYRQFLERLIRMEMPAHILPKICWIGQSAMQEFQTAYQSYLSQIAANPNEQLPAEELANFVEVLERLRTVYWPGTLHDCVDEGGAEEDNPIVLNRTFLGNLQNPDNNAN